MGQFEVPVNPDPRLRYAGLGSRAFAYAVDGILLGVLSPLVTRKCLATGNWRFVLGATLAWSIAVFLYRPVLTSASPVLTATSYRNAYRTFYHGSHFWLTVAFQVMAVLVLAAQMISILRSPQCRALHDRIAGTVVLRGRG